jgi:hypothetical protein
MVAEALHLGLFPWLTGHFTLASLLADNAPRQGLAWDMTALVLAVFAGSGPALVIAALTWLKARAAHTLASRTYRILREVRKLLEDNQANIADKAPLFARILALLESLDAEDRAKKP